MKKILSILALLCAFTATTFAQCPMKNRAFGENESLRYNLYFNWKFIWLKAGTASMTTKATTYRNRSAYSSNLITSTSPKLDRYFRMRDTLQVYVTNEVVPLYYRKAAHEGKRNYIDEVAYSYPNGQCGVSMRRIHTDGSVTREKKVYDHCVYDMLSIFLCARNYDATGWKNGHTVNIDITGGSELTRAKLVYLGKETVKADNGKKYPCLILSYREKDGSKDKEIVKFFVTDDKAHVPVRLDLALKFGSAKAFLAN